MIYQTEARLVEIRAILRDGITIAFVGVDGGVDRDR